MLFDTDVIIWVLRGNQRAAAAIDKAAKRELSVVSYMELVQAAQDKKALRLLRSFLGDLGFHVLPLTENIGHRATVYMEEYTLKSALGMADALIAATAAEVKQPLCTGNAKHYRAIADLSVQVFRA